MTSAKLYSASIWGLFAVLWLLPSRLSCLVLGKMDEAESAEEHPVDADIDTEDIAVDIGQLKFSSSASSLGLLI